MPCLQSAIVGSPLQGRQAAQQCTRCALSLLATPCPCKVAEQRRNAHAVPADWLCALLTRRSTEHCMEHCLWLSSGLCMHVSLDALS
jgi:hypothetical protein